jgi:N-acetylmuramoyl-L-alanine amidase
MKIFGISLFSHCRKLLLLSSILLALQTLAQDARFTVVIDAGHGGHDPGAMGRKGREKDINLSVSLLLGQLISRNFDDVKVVYTRKTDRYLTLQERADIVNTNHADLFISIHTNASNNKSAFGTETFTLGLAKTKANLDVAMRENSVILLEDDYKTKYKGFDPSSVESYIMFEFMQDKYIDKSIDFASKVQTQFVDYAKRSDRGVRQAGFWVLHRSACPSVLVELGFISNASEENYLISKSGQNELAVAIYNAFVSFKYEHDKKSGKKNLASVETKKIAKSSNLSMLEEVDSSSIAEESKVRQKEEVKASVTNSNSQIIFKVQLFASSSQFKNGASQFKGLKNVDFFVENNLYKYTLGSESDYAKIVKQREEILSKFPEAFIIAYDGKEKITAKQALQRMK